MNNVSADVASTLSASAAEEDMPTRTTMEMVSVHFL